MKKECLLKLSGALFTAVGILHIVRFFTKWQFIIGDFQLPEMLSLIIGVLLLLLAFFCLRASSGDEGNR